jgi:hypothetical protein
MLFLGWVTYCGIGLLSSGPILPSQKRVGGVAQGVDPEFKPQYCRKKKISILGTLHIQNITTTLLWFGS